MATPQSTTGGRARKKQGAKRKMRKRRSVRDRAVAGGSRATELAERHETNPRSLFHAIEAERSRLTTAQAVLGCLREALVAAEQRSDIECDFADVTSVVQELVREAVHRLDIVFLSPLAEALSKAPPSRRTRARTRAKG